MTQIYNSLPHILEVQHTPMPKVEQIQDILEKYSLGNTIGITRLHKHFDLEIDEKNCLVFWKK